MRSARMAEGSWLLAIMRSSVFRSRTASPYRYVSPSTPVTHPDTDHFASLEDQMASPIRVIPNILFLFRNQISRPTATGKRPSFTALAFSLLFLLLFLSPLSFSLRPPKDDTKEIEFELDPCLDSSSAMNTDNVNGEKCFFLLSFNFFQFLNSSYHRYCALVWFI